MKKTVEGGLRRLFPLDFEAKDPAVGRWKDYPTATEMLNDLLSWVKDTSRLLPSEKVALDTMGEMLRYNEKHSEIKQPVYRSVVIGEMPMQLSMGVKINPEAEFDIRTIKLDPIGEHLLFPSFPVSMLSMEIKQMALSGFSALTPNTVDTNHNGWILAALIFAMVNEYGGNTPNWEFSNEIEWAYRKLMLGSEEAEGDIPATLPKLIDTLNDHYSFTVELVPSAVKNNTNVQAKSLEVTAHSLSIVPASHSFVYIF